MVDFESILLCETCNAPYHSHCLTPPLTIIPDIWNCPTCTIIHNSPLPLITFTTATTYLGIRFAINNSPDLIFSAAVQKLKQRVSAYLPRKTSLSIHQRIITANVFLVSIFNYICSIYMIPPKLLKTIYATIGTWTSPKGSFETELLTHPRDHFGFTQPLKDIALLNAALIISATNLPTIQAQTNPHIARTSYPTSCIASDHLRKAIEVYRTSTHKDITTTPIPPDDPFPRSVKGLYKNMTLTDTRAKSRIPRLARKVRLLYKGNIKYETAVTYSRNLMMNFSSLPKSIFEHYRGVFIRLIYNALPLRGRIHRFAQQNSILCIFCNCDHETTQHLFFSCHIVQAAKVRLKDWAQPSEYDVQCGVSHGTTKLLHRPLHFCGRIFGQIRSSDGPRENHQDPGAATNIQLRHCSMARKTKASRH
jgi:hypothetical protein